MTHSMHQIPLPSDEIHLWFTEVTDISDFVFLSEHLNVLSTQERHRYFRLATASKRAEFLVAHLLLRYALTSYAPIAPQSWRFFSTSNGKPEINHALDCAHLRFNLSHTDGLVAICIANQLPVGIDAEYINRSSESHKLVCSQFSNLEISALNLLKADKRIIRFYQYWTLKEAFLKATGLGLTSKLSDFGFEFGEDGFPKIVTNMPIVDEGAHWKFFTPQLTSTHATAVATYWNKGDRMTQRPKLRFWKSVPLISKEEVHG